MKTGRNNIGNTVENAFEIKIKRGSINNTEKMSTSNENTGYLNFLDRYSALYIDWETE
jgi:hypothetical protein